MSLIAQTTTSTLDNYYLYKNPNAFDATVLSDEILSAQPNPFVVEKKDITPVSAANSTRVGLAASIANIDGTFLIDFNSDIVITWAENCT